VEPYNFVSALNCILAQRLVRLICTSCKRSARANRELLVESGLDPTRYADYVFYEGRGCIDCNGTGYRGRTSIAELLDMSDRIREMILQRRPGADIKRAAKEEGMTFLREAALAKVFAGKTSLREINKVTFVD
jgi:type IV pilus assembly protein PilB